jgi:hypothetical protein
MNAPFKPPDPPLSRKEAARYLTSIGCPISPKTLANLAAVDNSGGGPSFTRLRQLRVLYLRADLETWARAQYEKVT